MLDLFINLSANQADSYGLVLSSSGISHRVKRGEGGWEVWVLEEDYHEALKAIEQYLEEDRQLRGEAESQLNGYHWRFSGIWVSSALLACHVAVTRGDDGQAIMRACGSSASHILDGELYRTVTSLMIHAGPLHILGNVVGIGLFGTAVCGITGTGVGWLMILATGVVGNLVNALLYRTDHVSVGASTAVFGAIGILAAYQFFRKFRLRSRRARAWLPLAGGLALLGILGTGKHVDLTAHLSGFVTGMVFGGLYAAFVRRPVSRTRQASCLIIALGVVIMSWMRALGYV
jgi:rhomboid protease GluP